MAARTSQPIRETMIIRIPRAQCLEKAATTIIKLNQAIQAKIASPTIQITKVNINSPLFCFGWHLKGVLG